MDDGSTPLQNARWERFAMLVASGEIIAKSYAEVGFSPSKRNAMRLKAKPEVKARINHLKNAVTEKAVKTTGISKAMVLELLLENVEVSMGKKPWRIDTTKGKKTASHYAHNATAANRSLELLGRELGMFQRDVDDAPPPEEGLPPKTLNDPVTKRAMAKLMEKSKNVVVLGRGGAAKA